MSRGHALLLHALAIGATLLVLAPLAWMLLASLVPAGQAGRPAVLLDPSAWTPVHYLALAERAPLLRSALNGALLAALVALLSTLLNALAGYAFARLPFAGRDTLFALMLALLVVPAQIGMLPLFLLMKQVGLLDSWAGVVLPAAASVVGILMVRQYALGLPASVLDAARVDGAGEWRIFWSLVLPACRPVLATLALLTFMGTWNDFLWPLIVLRDERLQTLPLVLANLSGEHAGDVELMMAGAVVTVAPVLLLFVALQRHYVRGLFAGAVKG